MCNLYRMTRTVDEMASLFDVQARAGNVGQEVYPGYPGYVIAEGRMQTMAWGFPLTLKGKNGQALKPKPVNNARCDKLRSPFWRSSFEDRRCLIPMTAFAEAQGPKGGKTRTWLSLPDVPAFACGGIWRGSDEWGPVFSMVMTDASEATSHVHDRMPVILDAAMYSQWLEGSPKDAWELCRPYAGKIAIEPSEEPWVRR